MNIKKSISIYLSNSYDTILTRVKETCKKIYRVKNYTSQVSIRELHNNLIKKHSELGYTIKL